MQQAVQLGFSRWAVHRLVKVGHWQRLFPGIYLTHAGSPAWNSRAFAALLLGGPNSFLCREAAWYLDDMQIKQPNVITVSVPLQKQVSHQPGLRFIRGGSRVLRNTILIRPVPEETLLDMIALETRPIDVVGHLTTAFRKNVRADDVLKMLERRERYRHRKLTKMLLGAVVDGIESPLEYLFDENVEIPHGLPRSRKQVVERLAGRITRADRLVEEFLLRYELDGEFAHPGGRTDLDTWRDNAALIKNRQTTLRYRWANIVGTPCKTAAQIAAALQLNGWTGRPKLCGPNCAVMNYRP